MQTTKLDTNSKLPLTCTRIGTCCFGNQVMLNPWELHRLAQEKKISAREFRNLYTEFGGIRLKFNGKFGLKGKQACSQYKEGEGCSVHAGRPLACRLFPLGRQIQNEEVHYIHQGTTFPCLDGCAEVLSLPYLSVGEYLVGQQTEKFESSQDLYLELMQNVADIAFSLLLDTELASNRKKKTLAQWRKMGSESPEDLATRIGQEWMEYLILPQIEFDENPQVFVQNHWHFLQLKAEENLNFLHSLADIHLFCVQIMGLALHLARAVGANPEALADHWIYIAKSDGAVE